MASEAYANYQSSLFEEVQEVIPVTGVARIIRGYTDDCSEFKGDAWQTFSFVRDCAQNVWYEHPLILDHILNNDDGVRQLYYTRLMVLPGFNLMPKTARYEPLLFLDMYLRGKKKVSVHLQFCSGSPFKEPIINTYSARVVLCRDKTTTCAVDFHMFSGFQIGAFSRQVTDLTSTFTEAAALAISALMQATTYSEALDAFDQLKRVGFLPVQFFVDSITNR